MTITESTRGILQLAVATLAGPLPVHRPRTWIVKEPELNPHALDLPKQDDNVVPFVSKFLRTYYLGLNGRVSQREAMVGICHATTRARTTAEALAKFTASYRDHGCQPIECPYIEKRK